MAQTKYKLVITALNKTQSAFNAVKKGVGGVAKAAKSVGKVLGGVMLAVGAVATAFVAMGKKAFDALDEIGKTADRTGIATDKLQALRLGAVESGASVEDLNKSMEKFAKNIGDVLVKGTGEATYALDKMGIQLRDNGGRLKTTDTLLTEVVAGIGEMGTESERASTLMALFGKPGLKLNWVLGKGVEAMEAWSTKAKEMGIIVDSKAIKAVEGFNDRMTELKFLSDAFIKQTFAALAPGLEKMITHFTNWRVETNKLNGGLEELGTTIAEDLVEGLASTIEGFGTAIVFLQETHLWLKRVADRLKAASGWNPYPKKEWARIDAQYKEDLKNLDKFTKKTQEAADTLRGFFKKTEEVGDALTRLNEDGAKPFVDTVDKARASFDSFGVGFTKVTTAGKAQFNQMETLGTKVAQTLEDGLVNAFMNIGKGADSLRDLMDSILKMIISELIRVFIVQKAVGAFGTWSGLGPITPKALGGPVSANESYIVGEKGPEIFTPGQSGHITPNSQIGGGGANVNVSFNITAFDAQSATTAIAAQAPTIVGIVEQSFRKRGRLGPIGG